METAVSANFHNRSAILFLALRSWTGRIQVSHFILLILLRAKSLFKNGAKRETPGRQKTNAIFKTGKVNCTQSKGMSRKFPSFP